MFPTPEEDQAERVSWEKYKSDPICILLDHSDCDGEIANEHCLALAARLEEIAPKLIQGGLMALRFAKGLRDAAEAGEDVEFR